MAASHGGSACWRWRADWLVVQPGINEKFLDPNLQVSEWTEKSETESREIFHQREQILAALRFQPGMSVAEIGAGTELFTLPFAKAVGRNGRVFALEISKPFRRHIQL